MFWNRNKINVKDLQKIMPISKYDLKMQCLGVAKGNIDEADKLYHYLTDDMDLPDMAPRKQTFMEQAKQFVTDGFDAYKRNKDDISEIVAFVQSVIRKSPAGPNVPKVDLPPIPPVES